jgi:hypothetical protein
MTSTSRDESGFTIAEVIVAVGLLTTALIVLADLLALATKSNRASLQKTTAAVLARQKMEQMRALAWGFDARGLAVSDTTTDLAAFEASGDCAAVGAGAGVGLSSSPPGALANSVDGYVDYVDARGCGLGGGIVPPRGAMFVRRWSIGPMPSRPNDTLVLQVVVAPVSDAMTGAVGGPTRSTGEVRLVGVRTRKIL